MNIGMLRNIIGPLEKNIYFCGANEDENNVTIYAKDEKTRFRLVELLRNNPEFKAIKIATTRSLKLKKTRSLEEILTRIPHQTIYLDPTATIERSSILVAIAKEARQLLGPLFKGCYFNSETRNVYFLMKSNDQSLDLSSVQKYLEPIITHHTQRLLHPFYYTITISIQKPQGSVIAIDNASVAVEGLARFMKGLMNKMKWPLLLASATSTLGIAAKAENGTLPAVSGPNGWVGAAGDYLHNKRTSGAGVVGEGGAAVPLTCVLGAQVHGYGGFAGSAGIASVDGYVFWRNPTLGLVGPHVLYTKSNNFHHTLYGLHGEGYFGNLTLVLEGGGANENRSNNHNTGYGEAIVHWYAQPDWRLYAGVITIGGNVTGQVGTEYQVGLQTLPGLSIFADAGVGAHNLNYGFLGLRYYFGDVAQPNKSLICRQREDMVLPTLDPIDPRAKRKPAISQI